MDDDMYWELLEEQHNHDVYISGAVESEGDDETGHIQRSTE